MTAMTVREPRPARNRSRSFLLASRIVWMEVRHSAFVWAHPAACRPVRLRPVPDGLPAIPLSGPCGPRSCWTSSGPSACPSPPASPPGPGRGRAAATSVTCWRPPPGRPGRGSCARLQHAGLGAGRVRGRGSRLYVSIAQAATWGGPPIWPVAAGAVSLTAVCALAFTLGALFPGRFTAPIAAVGISVLVPWPRSAGPSAQGGVSVARSRRTASSLGTTRASSTPSHRTSRSSRSCSSPGARSGRSACSGCPRAPAAQAGAEHSISPAGEERGCAPPRPPSSRPASPWPSSGSGWPRRPGCRRSRGASRSPPWTTAPPTSRSRTPRSAPVPPAASRSACTRPSRAT